MNAFFYHSKRGINFAKIRGFKVTDYTQTPLGGHGGRSPSLCTAKKRAPHLRERLSAVRTRLEPVTSHGQRDCFTLPPSACADTPRGTRGSLAESLHRKKRAPHLRERLSAVRTRLELATPGVTGRYSNRLNYRTSPASLLEGIAKIVTFFNSTRVASDFFISL